MVKVLDEIILIRPEDNSDKAGTWVEIDSMTLSLELTHAKEKQQMIRDPTSSDDSPMKFSDDDD